MKPCIIEMFAHTVGQVLIVSSYLLIANYEFFYVSQLIVSQT